MAAVLAVFPHLSAVFFPLALTSAGEPDALNAANVVPSAKDLIYPTLYLLYLAL